MFFKFSILAQYLYSFLTLSHLLYGNKNILMFTSLTLNILIYPIILGIIKTNGLMVLSKYPIKYLQLVFVLTNFEVTIYQH